ncbi:hypothetical protein [Glutamicibacter arilaitensis]|uniref:Uncharacterized protein n=1 Tax=Glutamicibacter arilaitensis TaxID=256701 RepID=A0A4Y8TX21_9MICC|nr:hypothetical protein [Glutamicibacter arilaitensis]TFH56084.1 hypothetical protein EXY26_03205 [Glutamicibacter arilaitensis]
MTDEEFLAVLAAHKDSTSEQVWNAVVARTENDWVGDLNWEAKSDNAQDFDNFLQKAFAGMPTPPRLEYVETLVTNYSFSIADVPDSENKAIRAIEICYEKMIAAISKSIGECVIPLAESPDTDVEVSEVEHELTRFQRWTKTPKFLK